MAKQYCPEKKLKELRLKKLESDLLDVHLKGQDHYIFMNEINQV